MAEFTLLPRLAGFEQWQQFGDANREPFEGSVASDDSFWIVQKLRSSTGRLPRARVHRSTARGPGTHRGNGSVTRTAN